MYPVEQYAMLGLLILILMVEILVVRRYRRMSEHDKRVIRIQDLEIRNLKNQLDHVQPTKSKPSLRIIRNKEDT